MPLHNDKTVRLSNWHLIVLTLIAAASAVVVYYAAARTIDAANFERFKLAVNEQAGIIEGDLRWDFEQAYDLSRLFNAIENVTDRNFYGYLTTEDFVEHPSFYNFGWAPRVEYSKKEEFEQTARNEGILPDFYIFEKSADKDIPVAARDDYFPFYFRKQEKEGNIRIKGFDIASNPVRRKALEKARDTGQMAATEPIRLITDNESKAIQIYMPVYYGNPKTVQDRRTSLRGFTFGTFQVKKIFEKSFITKDYLNKSTVFEIEVAGLPKDDGLLYRHTPSGIGGLSKLNYVKPIEVAGQSIQIKAVPVKSYFSERRGWAPFLYAAGIFVIIYLTGVFLIYKTKSRRALQESYNEILEKLREKDVLMRSELALGRQLEESISELKQREILQDTIISVLEISLYHGTLTTKIGRVLDIVVSIPGLSIEDKGCIHLKADNAEELVMVAQRNLPEHLLTACARLKYGQCLCGIAASTGKTVFSNKLDEMHSISFEEMHEHGHYCIPIKTVNNILGVLCLYVKHNHERTKVEEDTFVAVTKSIANIIEHGKVEDDVKRMNKFTKTVFNSITDSIIVIDVKDFTIVSTNYSFLKEYKIVDNDVIGKHCYAVIHKASEPCNQQERSCPIMNMLRTGEYAMSEHVHYGADGKEIYLSCSASPIRNEAGNIVQCVYVLKNISQRKYYEKQLQQLAHYDVVTSLPNRILLLDRLNTAIEFSLREGNMIAVLFIDLDKFKSVNDTYGHETGDVLLKEVSKRLLINVRKSDTVSRVGGDEFIILLTKVNGKEDAGLVANKIIVSLNKPFLVNGHECHIGGSIGIEMYPFSDIHDEDVIDVLIKRADMAMYKAKENGKNRYEFYNSELSDETENPLFK
ncbi:MAG: diguanylate cyclase [Nitrospirae bacterium]|nr:diguanylate cyclase [Nitrospirota bacterium]